MYSSFLYFPDKFSVCNFRREISLCISSFSNLQAVSVFLSPILSKSALHLYSQSSCWIAEPFESLFIDISFVLPTMLCHF